MKWNWLINLASRCEDLCEREGRSQAHALAQAGVKSDDLKLALRTGDGLVRRKALHLLTLFDPSSAFDTLVVSLERDPSPVVRHEAAYFLGVLRLDEAVSPLVKSLHDDPCELVRHEAAEALGDLGSPKALDALLEAMNDVSSIVRETAEIALAQLSREEDVEA